MFDCFELETESTKRVRVRWCVGIIRGRFELNMFNFWKKQKKISASFRRGKQKLWASQVNISKTSFATFLTIVYDVYMRYYIHIFFFEI